MEDILENLGIILLIVISVVVQIAKAAKKASKAINMPSAETEEPVFEKPARKESSMTFSEIKPTYTLTTPMETKKQKKKGMPANKPNRAEEHHVAEEKQSMHNKVADTEKAKTAVSIDDFDLRKAIIYSEIMAPKFKEE